MSPERFTHRDLVRISCIVASNAMFLAACGSTAAAPTAAPASQPASAAQPTIAPAQPTAAASAPTAASVAPTTAAAPPTAAAPQQAAQQGGQTPVRIWFHWGGKTGEAAQRLIDTYNAGQGQQDKIHVTVETVSSNPEEYRAKMTAARMADTAPDVFHTGLAVSELVKNGIPADLPTQESKLRQAELRHGRRPAHDLSGQGLGLPHREQRRRLPLPQVVLRSARREAAQDDRRRPRQCQEADQDGEWQDDALRLRLLVGQRRAVLLCRGDRALRRARW